jgi:hypothetical protein
MGTLTKLSACCCKMMDEAKAGVRRRYEVAHVATMKGDRSLALDWLEKSYPHRDYWMLSSMSTRNMTRSASRRSFTVSASAKQVHGRAGSAAVDAALGCNVSGSGVVGNREAPHRLLWVRSWNTAPSE